MSVEIGQMMFGNKWSDYDTPDFVTAGFLLLEHEIQRVEWNRRQKSFESPLSDGTFVSGDVRDYKNSVFEIHSYYWGENKKLRRRPNFKCGKFEVRWYKHMGRGMTMNRDIDANTFFAVINKCMKYLQKKDRRDYEKLTRRIK